MDVDSDNDNEHCTGITCSNI